MKEISIYIHIPFCMKRCYYCDFTTYVGKKEEDIKLYMDSVIKELSMYKEELKDHTIKTIFIGGGTPSHIDGKYIKDLLDYIEANFNLASKKEVTIEINPESLNYEKAKTYKEAGINRVSLGLQTTNNKMLKTIGRIHDYDRFVKAYETLRGLGFENINVDLIFALPNQKLEDVMVDLERVVALGVDHISYYSLILEGDTPMEKWAREGRYKFPTDEEDRKMYHETVAYLESKGYRHYEISNFARENLESIHNKVYWEIKPYIGVGLASHSNFKSKRFWNTGNFKEYIDSIKENKKPVAGYEEIDRLEEISEYCIFGIRLIEGIHKKDFYERFSIDIKNIYGRVIKKHKEAKLLEEDKNYIRLTKKGLDLANLVEMDFLS